MSEPKRSPTMSILRAPIRELAQAGANGMAETRRTLMFERLVGMFSVDMGIDLGTCNTLVAVRGQGIVLNEPSVVAVRKGTNQVLKNGQAVGWVAKEMLGKTPGSITAVRPLKDGVISDFEITEAMLGYFIRKVNGLTRTWGMWGPRVVISIPSGITAVEKRAVF